MVAISLYFDSLTKPRKKIIIFNYFVLQLQYYRALTHLTTGLLWTRVSHTFTLPSLPRMDGERNSWNQKYGFFYQQSTKMRQDEIASVEENLKKTKSALYPILWKFLQNLSKMITAAYIFKETVSRDGFGLCHVWRFYSREWWLH